MLDHRGNVFVLSAPSGAGKSTLARRLVRETPGLIFSTSFTTRAPRPGERQGQDYFFVDDPTFDRMVAEEGFVEWVRVYEHRYGTGRAWLEKTLASGVDVLLDIETTGALNIRRAIPDATMIFLLPPSAQELERRLRGRGSDGEEQIAGRLRHARHEMELFEAYDYLVVNDDLDLAFRKLQGVVLAVRAGRERMAGTAEGILGTFQK
ncbi:MAG: guanylate kinase [Acidobacteria bacterium]|nr:guanylate kinase [Acidobacteriota bacterium]